MPIIKYPVALSEEQQICLTEISRNRKINVRERTRARILLRAHDGFTDAVIAETHSVAISTVARIRKRFVEEGLINALKERPRSGKNRKLSRRQEQCILKLIQKSPPGDQNRWTLRLLASHISEELGWVDSISHETIRTVLSRNNQILDSSHSLSEMPMG